MTSEYGPLRGALEHAMLQLHPAAAELRDQHFRMGREDDDRGAVEKALDPPPRLLPERRVAGADPLVDQQNIFMRGGRDGEGQPREHAGRIGAHRQRQEIAELGEFGDIVELGRDLAPAHAHHVAAQINILEAGRFRVHPRMGIEQRTDPPLYGDRAAARLVDAGEHAQKRRLARAVMADKADAVAIVDLKAKAIDGAYGDDIAGARYDAAAGRLGQDLVLERTGAGAENREFDRQVLDGNMRHSAQTQYAIRAWARR